MLAPPGARARVASGSCCRSDRQPAGRRGDSPSCRCPVPQGRVRHRGCCPSCTGRVGLFQLTMTGMDLRAVPGGGPAAEAIGSAAEAAAELARGPRADRPGRRAFTLAYKLRMLTEYDATVPGLKGEMLRREVLYSMHMVEWRRAKDRSPRRTPRRGTEVAREGPPTRVGTARTWNPAPPRAPVGCPPSRSSPVQVGLGAALMLAPHSAARHAAVHLTGRSMAAAMFAVGMPLQGPC